jgi:2-keto-3-deoxy-L-rhamnonate aldolase RhmA
MLDFTRYGAEANASLFLAVMIETLTGLKNAAAIASVPGIDLVFIGTGDLALSLGVFPQTGPKHERAVQAILAACRKAKTPCGLYTADMAAALNRVGQGFQWVVVGNDRDILQNAAKDDVARFARARLKASS